MPDAEAEVRVTLSRHPRGTGWEVVKHATVGDEAGLEALGYEVKDFIEDDSAELREILWHIRRGTTEDDSQAETKLERLLEARDG